MGKAAARLHVSQSTLTRQIQALEAEVGGILFERSGRGVVLTPAGHIFREGVRPHIDAIDRVVQDARRAAQGQNETLRIGYIASAVRRYLSPALHTLRDAAPRIKVKLSDLTPSQQIAALRTGQLDLALLGFSASAVGREFYARKLASVPAVAILPDSHRFREQSSASLRDLRQESFIAIPEEDAPGYNDWVRAICRKAGFRPRFAETADSMGHLMAMIAAEHLTAIVPRYATDDLPPGVHVVSLREKYAADDLVVAWSRGKPTDALREMLHALFPKTQRT